MKNISKAILLAALLPAAPLHGAKYAGEFLSIGYGSRALGMGGAFVSMAEGGFACYWNPAGTASGEHRLEFTHANNFDNLVSYDALGYARPGKGQGLGLAVLRLSVKDIPFTSQALIDLNGNGVMDPGERLDYDKITLASDAETAVFLNYSRMLAPWVAWGVNAKAVNKSVGDNSAWGLGLDAGLLARLPHRIRLGLNLQDATTTYLAWDTGAREVITPTAKLGVSTSPWFAPSLTLALDADVRFENRGPAANYHLGALSADVRAGAEYWIRRRLALRLGSDQGSLAAGAGLRLGRFCFDYAYLGHAELRGSTRLSASYGF
ncbi:MAG TPA: hypothetical protein DDW31_07475 [candidate division Zixibacteria bacterium]|jgi:hypothetical protein|nr:hypothetical protein [candidate division Zixibacteria bacterium]